MEHPSVNRDFLGAQADMRRRPQAPLIGEVVDLQSVAITEMRAEIAALKERVVQLEAIVHLPR